MNSRKMFFVMAGVLTLLICGLLTVVVVGNAYLARQSKELVAAKLDEKSLNEQQTALIKAKKDLQKYSELQGIARAIVPQDKNQAEAVREIVRFADESGVKLESITFDDSTLGQAPAAPAPAPAGEGGSAATGQTPTAPAKPPITQAKPAEGIPGVYTVPIVIGSTKNNNQFENFINFLSKMENNRRTAHVEKVSITPGTTPSGLEYINFSLTVNIFVKP